MSVSSESVRTTAPHRTGLVLRAIRRTAEVLLCTLPVLFLVGQAAADIALSVIAILFLADSAVRRSWDWLRTPWVALGLVIWAYLIGISALVAENSDASFSRALPFGRFVVFAAALQHWLLIAPAVRRMFLGALAGAVGFVALDVLIQFAFGQDLLGHEAARFRLTGPFEDPVPGAFLSRVSFPVVGLLLGWAAGRGRRALVVALGATVLLGVAMALTGERTAFVMFGFGLVLMLLLLPDLRRLLLVAGLACAVLVAGALAASPSLYQRMVGHTTYDLTDFWERRVGELFLRGFEVWGQAPVFGVGLKNFRTHCENADFSATGRVDQRCYTHPHHLYNEWLAETGVVGLAAFVLLVALWAKELVPRLDRRRADHALGVGAFVALAVFLWPLRPSMSFFSNWNGILFWTMLGLALAVLAPRPPAIRARPEG